MSTGANTGPTGAATGSTAADLGSTGTSKGFNVAVSGKMLESAIFRETLKYKVFGPIIFDYAPGEFFCWHFYAWRRGCILIMPAYNQIA